MTQNSLTSPTSPTPRPGEVALPGRTSPPYYPLALARGTSGEVAEADPVFGGEPRPRGEVVPEDWPPKPCPGCDECLQRSTDAARRPA